MTAIYQVDAFAERVFEGNPAAVVPMDHWPDDALLQSIAAENNLAETAFIVANGEQWAIRWFTPSAEVALCGHATLAAAHVIFEHLGSTETTIIFSTVSSGDLSVSRRDGGKLAMSFPAITVDRLDVLDSVAIALGSKPDSVWKGHYTAEQFDLVAVFSSRQAVADLVPDESQFARLGSRGVIATSRAEEFDFVSRYFAPAFGIPEDPVTGSAHCLLAPFWGKQLGKSVMRACQISPRTGVLECRLLDGRVELVGTAVDYLKGSIAVDL